MLTQPRWTHVALPTSDIEKAIEFYTTLTPLVVVHRREDELGRTVWLSNPGQVEDPFVLVLVGFFKDEGNKQPQLNPFAHIGIEVPNREDVDAIAEKAKAMGCLHWEVQDVPDPVGHICAVTDPDGNVIEISHNQKVFTTIRELWGEPAAV